MIKRKARVLGHGNPCVHLGDLEDSLPESSAYSRWVFHVNRDGSINVYGEFTHMSPETFQEIDQVFCFTIEDRDGELVGQMWLGNLSYHVTDYVIEEIMAYIDFVDVWVDGS